MANIVKLKSGWWCRISSDHKTLEKATQANSSSWNKNVWHPTSGADILDISYDDKKGKLTAVTASGTFVLSMT